MKVHVAWEHSSFKSVDLVAIKSFDPQAQIFNLSIFGKIWFFPSTFSEGYQKLNPTDKTLNLFVNDHNGVPSSCQVYFSWSKIQNIIFKLNWLVGILFGNLEFNWILDGPQMVSKQPQRILTNLHLLFESVLLAIFVTNSGNVPNAPPFF